LRLTSGRGSGLGSILVTCEAEGCNASRSLSGAFGDDALPIGCRGHRPWLERDDSCDRRIRAVQRGASNLYFGLVESALSIPPWTDPIQRGLGIYWSDIAKLETAEERQDLMRMLHLDERIGVPLDELARQVEGRLGRLEQAPDIRREEFDRFRDAAAGELGQDQDFQVEREGVPPEFGGRISYLARVTRLREVRALRGFTRLSAYAGPADDDRVAQLSAQPMDWLPAFELRGEGIFVALDEAQVDNWERREDVRSRHEQLLVREGATTGNVDPPRLVLLHTLAHVLMAEVALESGYTLAALRERIYAGSDMAGVLVYTGSPDSEGTLGGLARQGTSDRFARVLTSALTRAEWCSNDPLCGDGRLSLSDARSLAACHSCALVPETSCERFNRDLDRGMLVGVPGREALGFLRAGE
jgi:hypothetical protein